MSWSFSKSSELGPKQWSKKHPNCGNKTQSPININSSNTERCHMLCSLKMRYKKSDCDIFIKNNVPTISYDKGSYIEFKGIKYKLYQVTIHTSSLHSIDNVNYAGELNLYHKSSNGSIVIVCVLLDENDRFSSSQDFFEQFTPRLKKNQTRMSISTSKDWSVSKVIPPDKAFYLYKGSMPYPPCSDAMCLVFKNPVNITRKSLSQIKNIIQEGKNSRKTLPLNGRIVYFNKNAGSDTGQVYVQCKKVNVDTLEYEDEKSEEEMYYTKKDKKQSDNDFDEEDNSESRTKTIIRVLVYLSFIILGILLGMFAFRIRIAERMIIAIYRLLYILPRN